MQARSLWTKVATLIFLALLMAAATGLAPQVRPANTHLGVPPNNLVTLVSQQNEVNGGVDFHRVLPSGTLPNLFLVPAGQLLIVTDIDVTSYGETNVLLQLSSNLTTLAYLETGRSYHFTGGMVVPAGNGLTTHDLGTNGITFIRGYLMPAQ